MSSFGVDGTGHGKTKHAMLAIHSLKINTPTTHLASIVKYRTQPSTEPLR